jgi:hypothetical protein
MNNWIRNTRLPNASSPLLVEIGPGVFTGNADINIVCDPGNGYTGFTTYRGSGMDQTTLKGSGSGSSASVNVTNCTDLAFSDLKVATNFYGGIYWSGGGNSSWSNVHVDAVARAWLEPTCGSTRGKHYWFGSRLNSTTAFTVGDTYQSKCDETWFYGSEVAIVSNGGGYTNASTQAVHALGDGIIDLYGSNLRAFGDDLSTTYAALSVGTGEIHIHGTGIDAISATGKDVTALRAENGGFIHADVSAYVLKTTGTKTRISNNGGDVRAAYQWAQSDQPPAVVTENGADLFVETDCSASGCEETASNGASDTHLLIYNDNCPAPGQTDGGPWFDVVTGQCRNPL